MTNNIFIYGANGYTAGLIIQLALTEGAKPILAGRSEEKLAPLAKLHKLPMRAFALDDPVAVAKNLAGSAVVLNCAGPFSRTAKVMAEACIKAGAHYLDITGEIDVFEALALMGPKARKAGVMLMPGTGFDVVPSDCLAAHLKRRMPDASSLILAFQAIGRPSHGTATTMVENVHRGGMIRQDGKLTAVPSASAFREVDFGKGPVTTMSIPWGDVSTAWVSTAIANIEVFMAAPAALRWMAKASRHFGGVMSSSLVQNLLKKQIDSAPAGPNAEQRQRGASHLWGQVRNAAGQTATSRLDTVEGYALTALTAWDIAKRVANGEAQPGYRTPSLVFGADYILNFAGTTRTDL
ncbi:MAG: saccharopine dehydrogenase family protein [Rhodoferax sp.]